MPSRFAISSLRAGRQFACAQAFGSDSNCRSLQPTDMQNWTLLLPHRRMLLRLPYRRGAVVPEAHRRYLWSLGETRGGLKPAAPPNRPAVFGDDPEGFLSAPPLDSAATRFRAAYR